MMTANSTAAASVMAAPRFSAAANRWTSSARLASASGRSRSRFSCGGSASPAARHWAVRADHNVTASAGRPVAAHRWPPCWRMSTMRSG